MNSQSKISLVLLTMLFPHALLNAAEVVAISSVVFNGYTRERLADHSFKPESYVFGEGGCITRPVYDQTMQQLKFPQIAEVVAATLAQQKYLPAAPGAPASLLILVFWGSTEGSSGNDGNQSLERATSAIADYNRIKPADPSLSVNQQSAEGSAYEAALWQLGIANQERDRIDIKNARILGYTEAFGRAKFVQHMSMGQDVLQELGDNRYYVLLQAYGLKTAVKEKKLKPLWTTRLSVRERGDFGQALAWMVKSGSRFFGRDSDGLKRDWVRESSVDLGPLEVIDLGAPNKDEGSKQPPEPPPGPGATQSK